MAHRGARVALRGAEVLAERERVDEARERPEERPPRLLGDAHEERAPPGGQPGRTMREAKKQRELLEGEGEGRGEAMNRRALAGGLDEPRPVVAKEELEIVEPTEAREAMRRGVHGEVEQLVVGRERADRREAGHCFAPREERRRREDLAEPAVRVKVQLERRRAILVQVQMVPGAPEVLLLGPVVRLVADAAQRLERALERVGRDEQIDVRREARGGSRIDPLGEERSFQDDRAKVARGERPVDAPEHRDVRGMVDLTRCLAKREVPRELGRQRHPGGLPRIEQNAGEPVPVGVFEDRRSVLDALHPRQRAEGIEKQAVARLAEQDDLAVSDPGR